jgi:hypothetical protein
MLLKFNHKQRTMQIKDNSVLKYFWKIYDTLKKTIIRYMQGNFPDHQHDTIKRTTVLLNFKLSKFSFFYNIIVSFWLRNMKLILTYCIWFIVTWGSLRFIIHEADYRKVWAAPSYNKLYTVCRISFIPYNLILKIKFDIIWWITWKKKWFSIMQAKIAKATKFKCIVTLWQVTTYDINKWTSLKSNEPIKFCVTSKIKLLWNWTYMIQIKV